MRLKVIENYLFLDVYLFKIVDILQQQYMEMRVIQCLFPPISRQRGTLKSLIERS